MKKNTKRTINQLRDWGAAALSKARRDIREADTLLAFHLSSSDAYLISHAEEVVAKKIETNYKKSVKRRVKGTPIAYLTRSVGFYGLDFFVDERVLIPRPDTEVLVDWMLQHVPRIDPLTIADVGTGSGCLAITLATYFPMSRLYAIDSSTRALSVAKKNALAHKVSSRITFKKGSLLSPLTSSHIDVVVSNPPYLEKHELGNVPFEPVEALYGGKNGLEIIDTLITQILSRDDVHKTIIEIHPLQEAWLDMRMRHAERCTHFFIQDYSGKTRALIIEKK